MCKLNKVPTLDNEGRSVLFYATLGGNKNSFELLRQIEPDSMTCIDKRSYDGKTLLHIGNFKFVMFFFIIFIIAAQSHLSPMIQHILQLTPPEIIDARVRFSMTHNL